VQAKTQMSLRQQTQLNNPSHCFTHIPSKTLCAYDQEHTMKERRENRKTQAFDLAAQEQDRLPHTFKSCCDKMNSDWQHWQNRNGRRDSKLQQLMKHSQGRWSGYSGSKTKTKLEDRLRRAHRQQQNSAQVELCGRRLHCTRGNKDL
jgi:hypothetical protein